jgi:hypothetical protein
MLDHLEALRASEVPCRYPDADVTAQPEPIKDLIICFEVTKGLWVTFEDGSFSIALSHPATFAWTWSRATATTSASGSPGFPAMSLARVTIR